MILTFSCGYVFGLNVCVCPPQNTTALNVTVDIEVRHNNGFPGFLMLRSLIGMLMVSHLWRRPVQPCVFVYVTAV